MNSKTTFAIIIIIIIAIAIYAIFFSSHKVSEEKIMKIESNIFENGGNIPTQYTCYGNSEKIGLKFSDIPKETKSLALIVDDPDAPSGDFVHWVIWNIDPETLDIITDNPPEGATEGHTSLGKPGFVAPCPPSGTHHYNFKLFALDNVLSIPPSTEKSALLQAMEGHIIENTTLTGLYSKEN